MASFISRQPNGLLCRFSTIIDTVTDYNMTDEEYVEMCAEEARDRAREVLQNHVKPFEWVKEHFLPTNNTRKEFKKLIQEMSNPKL